VGAAAPGPTARAPGWVFRHDDISIPHGRMPGMALISHGRMTFCSVLVGFRGHRSTTALRAVAHAFRFLCG
jgi:hypothetical protein